MVALVGAVGMIVLRKPVSVAARMDRAALVVLAGASAALVAIMKAVIIPRRIQILPVEVEVVSVDLVDPAARAAPVARGRTPTSRT